MKLLKKSATDRKIGGVCAGIAEYLGVDPTVIRLLFVLALFFGTMGFWVYIVLLFIMPN